MSGVDPAVQAEALATAVQWCKDYARVFEVSYAEAAEVLWFTLNSSGPAKPLRRSSEDTGQPHIDPRLLP